MAKTKEEKQLRNLELLMYVFLIGSVGFVIGDIIWLGIIFVVLAIILMVFIYKQSKKLDEEELNANEMNENAKMDKTN